MALSSDKVLRFFYSNMLFLMLIGIIMVYSASYLQAKENFGSATYFFIRQLIFCGMGLVVIFILKRSDFSLWHEYGLKLHFIFLFLLLITFIPGVGISIKGAHRWIQLFGFSMQPGEMIKYTIIFPSLMFFDGFSRSLLKERLQLMGIILFSLAALVLQPDFGSFSICVLVILFVAFLSSFPRRYFLGILVTAFFSSISIIAVAPYRVQRVLTFLDPWKDPQGSGFQMIQSYLAFANGQIFGKGIGNSDEKLFYLPEAHNDFIFSVIGEEFGYLGICVIVLLFVSFIYWGFKLAIYAQNRLSMMLMSSVIFVIGIQAFLNMGVVLGLLPTKGMNLPFISYGGSSMLANAFGIGLFLSAQAMYELRPTAKESL